VLAGAKEIENSCHVKGYQPHKGWLSGDPSPSVLIPIRTPLLRKRTDGSVDGELDWEGSSPYPEILSSKTEDVINSEHFNINLIGPKSPKFISAQ
jgi:hypothetical protein